MKKKPFSKIFFDPQNTYEVCTLDSINGENKDYPIQAIEINDKGKFKAYFNKDILNTSFFNSKHFANDIVTYAELFPVLDCSLDAQYQIQKLYDFFIKRYQTTFLDCAKNIVKLSIHLTEKQNFA